MPSEIFQIWVLGTSTPLALCDLWTILRLIILQGSLPGLPRWPSSKGSAWYAGDTGSTPRSGRFPWRRAWHTLQYSRLENPMHRGAWGITVYKVAKGQTWLKWLTTHPCMCVCVCVCVCVCILYFLYIHELVVFCKYLIVRAHSVTSVVSNSILYLLSFHFCSLLSSKPQPPWSSSALSSTSTQEELQASRNWVPPPFAASGKYSLGPNLVQLLNSFCRFYILRAPCFSLGFPCGSAGKESTCNAGDLDSIPGLERSLGERNGY